MSRRGAAGSAPAAPLIMISPPGPEEESSNSGSECAGDARNAGPMSPDNTGTGHGASCPAPEEGDPPPPSEPCLSAVSDSRHNQSTADPQAMVPQRKAPGPPRRKSAVMELILASLSSRQLCPVDGP
uniref:Uncharacterized protein n=1 Tax=Eutreptiella gymnastica TaxID=73025 RepID=A0A7S4CJR2_9EUGL